MLGPRTTGELAGCASAGRGPLCIAAWASSRTIAVEDWLAALKACAGRLIACACDRSGLSYDRRFVDRPGPGLRHHHTARRGRGCCGGCSQGMAPAAMRWNVHRGIDDFVFNNCESVRVRLRCGCGKFLKWWSDDRCGLNSGFRRRSGSNSRRSGRGSGSGCDSHRLCDRGNRNLGSRGRFGRARLGFAGRWNRGRGLQPRGRRRDNHHRTRWRSSACRRLGDHGAGGRARGDGRRSRWNHDGRRGSRLGNNLARFGTARLRRNNRDRGRGRGCCSRGARRRGRRGRRCFGASLQQALLCLLFFLLLGGQDGLHHVAGLGDVREIDFGHDRLRSARGRGTSVSARTRSTLIMCANLCRLVLFQRTGMSLAAGQAEFRQYVKNLPALDFHLAREIVDTNLTHPPLFKMCYPKPLVAHSYLLAMAALQTSVVVCLVLKGAHVTRRPPWPPDLTHLRLLRFPALLGLLNLPPQARFPRRVPQR